MAKNTSIYLGEYFQQFIDREIRSGRFSSASEVVRAALRMFAQEEEKKKMLVKALVTGESSGIAAAFDRKTHLESLRSKRSKK